MKKLLALLVLVYCTSHGLFAQTNPLRDEKLRQEKERKQILRNKIKEAVVYLYNYKVDSLAHDSLLIGRMYYDELGYLSSLTNYRPSQYGNAVPPNTYTFTDLRDENGNIIQHTMLNEWYTKNSNGVFIKIHVRQNDYDNQSTTYLYDKYNNVVKDVDHFNSYINYGAGRKERLGTGITYYTYDDNGNLASKKSHDLDGKFTYRNEYRYNAKNRLLEILTWLDSASVTPTIIQEYKYKYTHRGLIKIESFYNNPNTLTAQNEFDYDKHGNQVKGYEITQGVKRLVWDYSYNTKDQVIKSIGGPGTRFGPGFRDYSYRVKNQITESTGVPANQYVAGSMDIRRDGLANLYYSYDDDGNLIEIRKYEIDAFGNEKLTMAEKIFYKKY
jgi:hypothetical protein